MQTSTILLTFLVVLALILLATLYAKYLEKKRAAARAGTPAPPSFEAVLKADAIKVEQEAKARYDIFVEAVKTELASLEAEGYLAIGTAEAYAKAKLGHDVPAPASPGIPVGGNFAGSLADTL